MRYQYNLTKERDAAYEKSRIVKSTNRGHCRRLFIFYNE